MEYYPLNDFKFYIDGNRAEIQVAENWGNRIWCKIEEARNVYRAVKTGALEHSKDKDSFQTIKEVRAFLDYEYLFEEYDESEDGDTVCVIMIRKDYTAYIKKYTWNEWRCGTMLGRDFGWSKRCSDGKVRHFDYA